MPVPHASAQAQFKPRVHERQDMRVMVLGRQALRHAHAKDGQNRPPIANAGGGEGLVLACFDC
jgi:hypothetical protein